jgi:hypothetical protein
MIRTMKLLSFITILTTTGCDSDELKNGGTDDSKNCPDIARMFCVETSAGVYETKNGITKKDQCEILEPEGQIVDMNLCQQNYICTDDAMLVCKEITSGIYIEAAVGREGPECKFPIEGAVDAQYCKGTIEIEELTSSAQLHDGKEVSITGSFEDFRSEPVPGCDALKPFEGTPTLSTNFLPAEGGFGVKHDDLEIKASFGAHDTRNLNSEFIGQISADSRVTLHGIFRYKTLAPICSNGSTIHPSGTVELKALKQQID